MVVGIIGVLFAWIPLVGVFGLILGILALVFGFLGHKNARSGAPGKGMATAGIVLGVASIALFGLATVLPLIVVSQGQEIEMIFSDIQDGLDP